MKKRKSGTAEKTITICFGGLFIAFFAIAGNIPGLSAIYLVPNVPITLQVFLVAMMGLILGARGGAMTLSALLILTFCGVPLMSGGKGGPGVFVGPTAGYIFGWYFIVLLLGFYHDFAMDKYIEKKILSISLHVPVSFLLGMVGVLLDYFCGSVGVMLSGGSPVGALPAIFVSNFAFAVGDILKIAAASVFSLSIFATPQLKRMLKVAN